VPDGAGTVRVGYGDLVNVALTLLYAQGVWPILADALAGLDNGDPTLFVRLLKQLTRTRCSRASGQSVFRFRGAA